MMRLLAFALHADAALVFTRGLCADDEPDLRRKSLSGETELWIEVGLPEARRLRKACRQAKEVLLYAYGGRTVDVWWQRQRAELADCANLSVLTLDGDSSAALAARASRAMRLACTLDDEDILLADDQGTLSLRLHPLQLAGRA